MPFDPAKPADHSPLVSAEVRGQLTALKALIDAVPAGPPGAQGPPGEVTAAALNASIAGTSSNSNAVGTLGMMAAGFYDPGQMQAVINRLDELITALRR